MNEPRAVHIARHGMVVHRSTRRSARRRGFNKIDRMFETIDDPAEGPAERLSTRELAALIGRLAGTSTDLPDSERVDLISACESLKSAAAALQVRVTAAFADSQRVQQEAAGVRYERIGQGIAAQVALARRESPARAVKYVGWAKILARELPATFAALERGEITGWRAMIVARETIWLSGEQRAIVDAELAPRIAVLGDREVEAETRRIGYRLDPAGFVARSRNAERDRRVSLRPAPDTMARLTALLPVAQGVAAYAALTKAAETARASGDPRGRGQVMADTLIERVTGQATADGVPAVEINLVMTDHTLLNTTPSGERVSDPPGGGDEPAHLVGYGPIPAGLARDLAHGTEEIRVWVRRLYTDPCTGHLAVMDTKRRPFPAHLRRAIIIRDQLCRTPWCGAPIRHTDHAKPHADNGQTTFTNGQGLCEACNYAKQATGWSVQPGPGGTSEAVTITTPTGHTYTSRPPDLPGTPPAPPRSGPRAGPALGAGSHETRADRDHDRPNRLGSRISRSPAA